MFRNHCHNMRVLLASRRFRQGRKGSFVQAAVQLGISLLERDPYFLLAVRLPDDRRARGLVGH